MFALMRDRYQSEYLLIIKFGLGNSFALTPHEKCLLLSNINTLDDRR